MKAQLRVLSGKRAGLQIISAKSHLSIGRHPGSDIQFDPHTDLDVSAKHAELTFRSGHWYVTDLGSKNGTLVNGHRIERETRLDDTDQITFGASGPQVEFRLVPDSTPDSITQPAIAEPAVPYVTGRGQAVNLKQTRGKGSSTTQRIRIEVARQTKGFRAVLLLLFATLGVTIASFFVIDARRKRSRLEEISVMQIMVDSILHTSEQTIAELRGEMAGLADVLRGSHAEVTSLGSALIAARESGDTQQVALLRQRLDTASAALRNQQNAASVDWNAVWSSSQLAVAMVWVEFGPGEVATGTAFAVNSDGTLLTNRHVVAGVSGDRVPTRIAVKFADSYQVFSASVLATSSEVDLAVLRVNITGGVPTTLSLAAEDAAARPGQPAVIIGFPLGTNLPQSSVGSQIVASPSLTAGTISKVLRDVVQLDAYGAQGSSGSPILSREGLVVGVLYGGRDESGGRIVFGVPASYAHELLNSIR